MKKVNILCHSFQKVKPIYYIDSLHIEWNISSLHFLKLWWLWLADSENPIIQCLRKFEYYIRSIKKGYFKQKYQASEKYFNFYALSTWLVGPPFAWITVSMRRGMEEISLWHGSGVMEAQVALIAAFRSSALLGLVSLIFLLTIPHIFSMGFRSGEFAGQSSTVTPWSLSQLLVPLAVWAGAKSYWKMKSASLKSLPAEGSMKCSKMSW